MRTEIRFLLAILLMLGVLIGTNLLFPPVVPEEEREGVENATDAEDPASGAEPDGGAAPADPSTEEAADTEPAITQPAEEGAPAAEAEGQAAAEGPPEEIVRVRGPLFRYEFSTRGARMVTAEMSQFEALNRDGRVDLVPEEVEGYFGQKLVVGEDTLDLTRAPYRVEPSEGLELTEGGEPETLRFFYAHPTGSVTLELAYTFYPGQYQVDVEGRVAGLDRPLLLTDVGEGLAYSEADSTGEARMMAYVYNHLQDGIESTNLDSGEPGVVEGPLLWTAFRSKFFVMALLAGRDEATIEENGEYLGGVLVSESTLPDRVSVAAAQTVRNGEVAYRLFMGPQEYARLSSLGQGMEEVNPYGWRFFRPIIRPFVSIIMTILVFFHTNLDLGYGWVLILFGVLMRVVLFPLNHKAMKAQLRNMAVQPLVQEIQTKHKDNPEKLQKEMMRLYKEHGFNPFAGCLPMLLPWPVLIALFFVFQNTIELRGVEFLWLPDLSAKDPLFILPVILAGSMFLMQWVSMKSLDQPNPQMKMMMWIMPGMMLFIFLNLASGLNLYYATANLATIPQQVWIARERRKIKGRAPPTLDDDGE
ncbi:MAG: membrane protein insertase YidC [Gemmatimonadota bacterium]|nr:membrane protein insertase YidC [Gemmatimonadota bacterium]